MALVLVQLDENVGGGLVVKQQHDEQRLLVIHVTYQLSDIGRVHVLDLSTHLLLVLLVNEVVEVMDIFFGKFFHFSLQWSINS